MVSVCPALVKRTGRNETREPYVVSFIHTFWTDAKHEPLRDGGRPPKLGRHYRAYTVTPVYMWLDYRSLNYQKLAKYALEVCRRVRISGEKGFRPLAVGARLDIDIAPDGDQIFVNEPTRWYDAHHFALATQSQPGDKIRRAYAKAFAETMGKQPSIVRSGKLGTNTPYKEVDRGA